jgi:hypothetical protein
MHIQHEDRLEEDIAMSYLRHLRVFTKVGIQIDDDIAIRIVDRIGR